MTYGRPHDTAFEFIERLEIRFKNWGDRERKTRKGKDNTGL